MNPTLVNTPCPGIAGGTFLNLVEMGQVLALSSDTLLALTSHVVSSVMCLQQFTSAHQTHCQASSPT